MYVKLSYFPVKEAVWNECMLYLALCAEEINGLGMSIMG